MHLVRSHLFIRSLNQVLMESFLSFLEKKVSELGASLDPGSPSYNIWLEIDTAVFEERLRITRSSVGSSTASSCTASAGSSTGLCNPTIPNLNESLRPRHQPVLAPEGACLRNSRNSAGYSVSHGVSQSSRVIRKHSAPVENLLILRSSNPHVVASAKKRLVDSSLLRTGQANIVHFNSHERGVSYIHCESGEGKTKLKAFLENSGFPVRDPKIKDQFVSLLVPQSFVQSFQSSERKEGIRSYLENRDPKFRGKVFSVEEIIRSQSRFILVLRVQAELFEAIRADRSTFIDTEKVFFKPWFSIKQCFRCSAYGHLAKKCSSGAAHCPYCSLEHPLEKCTKLTIVCHNCLSRGWASDHPSYSKECPVRKEYINSNKIEF